jgi:hypothetical protein
MSQIFGHNWHFLPVCVTVLPSEHRALQRIEKLGGGRVGGGL